MDKIGQYMAMLNTVLALIKAGTPYVEGLIANAKHLVELIESEHKNIEQKNLPNTLPVVPSKGTVIIPPNPFQQKAGENINAVK